MYYTYMLRCQDNSIYTGITTDIYRRMSEHFGKTNKCAKYTYNHIPIRLEKVWESDNRVLASKLEYHIKKLEKKYKEAIIKDNELLKKYLGSVINVEMYRNYSLRKDSPYSQFFLDNKKEETIQLFFEPFL